MQYGISEEPNAAPTSSNLIQVSVTPSGLWVDKKYVHLGASPDGDYLLLVGLLIVPTI